MTIDLKAEIRKWAIDTLPYDRSDKDVVSEINGKNTTDLLIIFHNWLSRQVSTNPRKVHLSKAYTNNPIAMQRKSDLDALICKIENGIDLKPHLSKRVDTVIDIKKKKISQRRDLDLMLNDWRVHHLHISQNIQSDGFVKRDDPLLFVVFHMKDAYLLDIMTHNDFNRDHVLEIMAREFPGADLLHEVQAGPGQDILGLAEKLTEEERNVLRKKAVNTLVEVDGKVYQPAGGMTTAGTSIISTMAADRVISKTENLEKNLRENPEIFQDIAQKNGLVWPEEPKFEFGMLPLEGLAFKEIKTNLAMKVS